jgi:flagellar motor protein MotB
MKRATLRIGLAILLIAGGKSFGQQQQTQQPSQQEIQLEQQRQEAARRAAEEQAKQQEAMRKQILDSISAPAPVPLSRSAPKQVTERCLAQAMQRSEARFDLKEIPLKEWLAAPNTNQFPWKVDVRKPELRMDQRYELSYGVEFRGKDLKWSHGPEEIRYVSGVSNADGQFLVAPQLSGYAFDKAENPDFRVRFTDCVFLQPGDYVLWIVVVDKNSAKRNVVQRKLHVPEFSSDVLPKLTSSSPAVEFPQFMRSGQRALPKVGPHFSLPVSNKQGISVDLVSMLSPSDQWSGRVDIMRWINNRVLNATAALSQIQLSIGSISTVALDLVNRSIPFREHDARELNWSRLTSVFAQSDEDYIVRVPALEALKQHGTFLRNTMNESLTMEGSQKRAFIFVSGSLLFERGSEVSPIKLEGDCNCRAYHVRLQVTKDDVFDDLEKVIKPLHPKTFDVLTPRDFRNALDEIVRDLNQF